MDSCRVEIEFYRTLFSPLQLASRIQNSRKRVCQPIGAEGLFSDGIDFANIGDRGLLRLIRVISVHEEVFCDDA